ncbi:hypothetical protein CF117_12810 [Aeromonas veronii]|nr:hypothetical protein CF127_05295 [Aeromonas veronii]TNI53160.1 hypothetical protein CF125_13775 [Aeromonas veronii]TNJ03326.1 hypothetical protein CF117_12810 [Aeromonas veronii]
MPFTSIDALQPTFTILDLRGEHAFRNNVALKISRQARLQAFFIPYPSLGNPAFPMHMIAGRQKRRV